jgi:hypothetical protein
VVLRLLILKHIRNWSYEVLEREVRANLVYRAFARIGAEKVPDAKTLGRLGQVVGPDVVADLHRRLVEIALEQRVIAGRRMRVDTTIVETNIHYRLSSKGWRFWDNERRPRLIEQLAAWQRNCTSTFQWFCRLKKHGDGGKCEKRRESISSHRGVLVWHESARPELDLALLYDTLPCGSVGNQLA